MANLLRDGWFRLTGYVVLGIGGIISGISAPPSIQEVATAWQAVVFAGLMVLGAGLCLVGGLLGRLLVQRIGLLLLATGLLTYATALLINLRESAAFVASIIIAFALVLLERFWSLGSIQRLLAKEGRRP